MIRNVLRWNGLVVVLLVSSVVGAGEWVVPVGGNAFLSEGEEGRGVRRDGTFVLSDPGNVYSVYFHVDRPAKMEIWMNVFAMNGVSDVVAKVGEKEFVIPVGSEAVTQNLIGDVEVSEAGYVRVDLHRQEGRRRGGVVVRDVVVKSEVEGLTVDYVKSNEGNMFYWGRRGPSVHLTYVTPRDVAIEYAYNEVTVPAGEDVEGSYFMANGFGEGYFGMQVNGPSERRVLFSVWSPFSTDNPKEIPEDQRIEKLASGPGVRVGEFGNEGSGGQSFMVYPWKAGTTYCFLTEVKPDGKGSTVYTSWFGEKGTGEMRLIASFRRPRTETTLTRFHSFLENFDPATGNVARKGLYGNQWVRDVNGAWHECVKARFTVDATGGAKQRLDFTGGAEGKLFFMKNCGFFNETGKVGDVFEREASGEEPGVDVEGLPRR